MHPDPHRIKLPLKDGLRGLRSTIREEARSGGVSRRLFGVAAPSREVARIADDVLSRAQSTAARVLRGEAPPRLGDHMDRLGRAACAGRRPDAREIARLSLSQYRVLRAVCDRLGHPEAAVLETRLARAWETAPLLPGEPARSLASITLALAAARPIRGAATRDLDLVAALAAGLAVLVRLRSAEPADAVIDAATLVAEAEAERWRACVDTGAAAALAEEWERIAPYLP